MECVSAVSPVGNSSVSSPRVTSPLESGALVAPRLAGDPAPSLFPFRPPLSGAGTPMGSGAGSATIGALSRTSVAALRSHSGSRTIVGGRSVQDSALMQTLKKQMDDFQEKMNRQIQKVEKQCDNIGHGTVALLEEKVRETEIFVPRVEKRVTEMSGSVKGLSEEMQAQIRRVDGLDDRLWDALQHVKEEMGAKISELDRVVQKLSSSFKVAEATTEDRERRLAQRIARLENDTEKRASSNEETTMSLQTLVMRLDAVEADHISGTATALANPPATREMSRPNAFDHGESYASSIKVLEQKFQDLNSQTDRTFQDAHDMHTLLAEQQVAVNTVKTRLDMHDEIFKEMSEKVARAGDIENKFDAIRQSSNEHVARTTVYGERLEILGQKLENQDNHLDDLRTTFERSSLRAGFNGFQDTNGDSQVEELKMRIDDLSQEIVAIRGETSFGPKVNALVGQLQDIVPKVVDHDRRIREMSDNKDGQLQRVQEKIESVESRVQALISDLENVRTEMLKQGENQKSVNNGDFAQQSVELQQFVEAQIAETKVTITELEDTTADLAKQVENVQSTTALMKERDTDQAKRLEEICSTTSTLEASSVDLGNKIETVNERCAGLAQEVVECAAAANSIMEKDESRSSAKTAASESETPAREDPREVVASATAELKRQLRQEIEGKVELLEEGVHRAIDAIRSDVETNKAGVQKLTDTVSELDVLMTPRRHRSSADETIAELKTNMENMRQSLVEISEQGCESLVDPTASKQVQDLLACQKDGNSEQLAGKIEQFQAEVDGLKGAVESLTDRVSNIAEGRDKAFVERSNELTAEFANLKLSLLDDAKLGDDGGMREAGDANRAQEEAKTENDAEVACLRRDVTDLQSKLESKPEHAAEMERFRKDVADLRSHFKSADFERFQRDIDELRALYKPLDLEIVRKDVAELQSRGSLNGHTNIDALRSEFGAKFDSLMLLAGASYEEDEREKLINQLSNLTVTIKDDETAEEQVHQKLISRIDELCERLFDMEGTLGKTSVGQSDQENFMKQVNALGTVQREIQEKFDGFVTQFAKQLPTEKTSPAGSGEGI